VKKVVSKLQAALAEEKLNEDAEIIDKERALVREEYTSQRKEIMDFYSNWHKGLSKHAQSKVNIRNKNKQQYLYDSGKFLEQGRLPENPLIDNGRPDIGIILKGECRSVSFEPISCSVKLDLIINEIQLLLKVMLGRLQLIKTHLGYKLQSVIQFNSPNITWLQIHELLNISYGLLCASRRVSLVYTNLFKFDFETSIFFAYVNHARICSWNQPVLSN